jgi:hypothetical protein
VNAIKFSGDQGTNIYYANKTFSKSKSLTQYAPAYNTSINLFIDTENRNTIKNAHPLEAYPPDTKPRTSRSPDAKNLLLKGGKSTKNSDTHQCQKNKTQTHQLGFYQNPKIKEPLEPKAAQRPSGPNPKLGQRKFKSAGLVTKKLPQKPKNASKLTDNYFFSPQKPKILPLKFFFL